MARPTIEGGTPSTLTPAQAAADAKATAARAALQTASDRAKTKPTPANVAAVKRAAAAVKAAPTVAATNVAEIQKVAKTLPSDITSLQATIAEANAASAAATAATDEAATTVSKATGNPKVGTLLRYEVGKGENSRIPVYADGMGGEFQGEESINPVIAGSTGTSAVSERTLAKDTFANTLALAFGTQEATQPWVNEMYNLASGFYNTGSTIEESLNLSLYEAKAKGLAPQFTKRFKGVFDLQEKLQKGEAVTVPTIAEFIKSEAAIGDTLREAGLGDIATQDFIGSVIGAGNSILDVGNLISSTFASIDNAPAALRKTLDTHFPSVDRVSLAKALLTGSEGAAALDKKIKGISVLSAAGSQGISVDLATASDLAARGVDYGTALTGFGQVKDLQRADVLGRTQGQTFSQTEAIGYAMEQNQTAKEKAERIKAAEIGKFQGEAGLSASALRGKNTRQQV